MRRIVFFLVLVPFLLSSNFGIKISSGGMYGFYSDLNMFVDYESSWLHFYNDSWAKSLQDAGFISNYTSSGGKFKKLSITLPATIRLYMERGNTTFFVEGSYLGARAKTSVDFNYSITFPDASSTTMVYSYSPFELKSDLFGMGVGISRDIFKRGALRITGEVSVGAIYFYAQYRNTLISKTTIQDYWLSLKFDTNMKGKGLGFYGYAALDIPVVTKGRFTLSIKPGFIYTKILAVSGPTSYTYSISDSYGFYSNQTDSWKGEWFIKEIDVEEWWGKVKFRFPSNYKDDLDEYVRNVGKFSPSIYGTFVTISIGFSL